MADLKLFLQSLYDKDPEDFRNNIPYDLDFKLLPNAISGDEEPDEDEELEQVDFENNEILSIDFDTNTITLVAGGDWQLPTEFSATLQDDCMFHCNEDSVIQDATYKDGLTEEEIKKMIER